jgi:hypothetical protein
MTTKPKKPVLPPRLEKRQNAAGKTLWVKTLWAKPRLESC